MNPKSFQPLFIGFFFNSNHINLFKFFLLKKQYEVSFMETSAKTGQNVELAFMAVAR